MTPWWSEAIELLLKQKKVTKQALERNRVIPRRELLGWKTLVFGPSVAKLDTVLKGIGATWSDWADLCEKVQRDLSNQALTQAKGGRQHTYVQKSRKLGSG